MYIAYSVVSESFAGMIFCCALNDAVVVERELHLPQPA
jgi:hypothetical protein